MLTTSFRPTLIERTWPNGPDAGQRAIIFRRFVGDRVSAIALFVLLFIIGLTVCAPFLMDRLWSIDPNRQDLMHDFAPPSAEHWGGTDGLGRDMIARVLWAGQISLGIGLIVTATEMTLGLTLGMLAGYYHGWVDDVVNLLLLTRSGIPTLYLLILLSVMFRDVVGTPWGLAIVLGLLGWPGVTRQVRGLVLSMRQRDFIEAARVAGASEGRIMVRHLLPNVMYIVFVIAGFDVIGAMLSEAALSYLGLGVQLPAASWGNLLSASLDDFGRAPWLVFLPGLFISATTISIFLVVDGLRDALDPQSPFEPQGPSERSEMD